MSRLFRDVEGGVLFPQGSVVCIGAFDGLHRGHRALVRHAAERARALGVPAVALAFEPLPREFFARDTPPPRLMLARDKVATLRGLAAFQMYRRHVRQRVGAEHTLRFLLQNDGFPRSVGFCLARAQGILPTMPARPEVARVLRKLVRTVNQADPAALAAGDAAGFMDGLQLQLGALHQAIDEAYFHG